MNEFTFEYYEEILAAFKEKGYEFTFFNELDKIQKKDKKIIILRHDIDFDPFQTKKFDEIEKKHEVRSTYFFLLTSKFYNIHNAEVYQTIKAIIDNGNRLGLHFDEGNYNFENNSEFEKFLEKEINFLQDTFAQKVEIVSFHRPTDIILLEKIKIPIAHTYNNLYFKKMKYLSDSRKELKEGNLLDIINSERYAKIQLLLHPFWWHETKTNPLTDYDGFIDTKILELKKEISKNSKIYQFEG